jgi:hypothetical protein
MRSFIFALVVFVAGKAMAQTPYQAFQWKSNPALHTINPAFKDAPAVFIEDQRIIEYAFEKNQLYLFRTFHRIIHINSDKGIEAFNKIYLPVNEGIDMLDVKARTILPNGKIIEMDRRNIKDLKDNDGQYKIFALEGLVKGSEVEFYFTIKKAPSFFGREVLSSRIPAQKARFELISPNHLFFEAKSYNQLSAGRDTIIGEKRHLVIQDENLAEIDEEKYAMYQASQKRVEYKLAYNKANQSASRLFTWDELAKKVYEIYYTVPDKDKRRVNDLLKEIRFPVSATVADKIRIIEHFLKQRYFTKDDVDSDDAEDLSKALKNKIMSERALVKLYATMYQLAGIDFNIVLAGDRSDYTVERSFENWNNAANVVLYFPATRKFLAPTQLEYRYPWIPPTWAGTNGLYCVTATIGNFTTAVAEVKQVQMEAFENSYQNLDVSIKMDKDEAVLDVKQLYGGYAAPNYRAPFVFMPAEEQRSVLKQLIKFGTNSENILSNSFENKELEQADPYKPFIINATVRSSNLVERAGSKLMIKIGEVIGPQAEMYDEKPRMLPIELGFPHVLVRTIRFTVPEGYRVANLKDLNIDYSHKEKDVMTMGFVTTHELKGNVLTIMVNEVYRNTTYPLSQYDIFKKVINAAADFNKIVLILEKAG